MGLRDQIVSIHSDGDDGQETIQAFVAKVHHCNINTRRAALSALYRFISIAKQTHLEGDAIYLILGEMSGSSISSVARETLPAIFEEVHLTKDRLRLVGQETALHRTFYDTLTTHPDIGCRDIAVLRVVQPFWH